jgi:small subunit ribosomal protein S8
MTHTDSVADLLTRIRNANHAKKTSLDIGHSILKESIAKILVDEGYVTNVEVAGEAPRKLLKIWLKYTADRRPVLTDAQRVSRPGRRVYVGHENIRKVRNGLGISILTTPKGIMTDTNARYQRTGGEILCEVW